MACEKQPDTIPVTGISLEPASVELFDGESVTITVTVSPGDATNKKVKWTSDNSSILVSDGRITASFNQGAPTTSINGKSVLGQGTITAMTEDGGKMAKCQVTVYAKIIAVTGVRLSESSLQLGKGESHTLAASVLPDNASDKAVQWTSSDTSVATVDQNGTITAIGVGKTTITASVGGFSASCSVSVVVPVTSISLDTNLLLLTKGAVAVLTATVSPDDATDKTVQWSSDNPSVATVDQNGHVTAVNRGDATITASVGDVSAKCSVSVFVPVTSVTLNSTNLTLLIGETALLEATVLPEDADDINVIWRSSCPEVATVDGGKITALDFGQTVITAQAGSISASCQVTVLIDSPSGVVAEYYGGDVSSSGDFVQAGSRLVFGVSNMSTETIIVKSIQLIDGVSGDAADIMPLGGNLDPGTAHQWTIDVPEAGIHSPAAVFTYTYRGEEHTCSAQFRESVIRIVSRP